MSSRKRTPDENEITKTYGSKMQICSAIVKQQIVKGKAVPLQTRSEADGFT